MNKELKIGFMGTASVGKSTTAIMLSSNLGIELHTELESKLIRKLIKKGEIENKYNFSPEQSKKFQNRSFKIRNRLSLRKSFISDRTAGELWVYHKLYCEPHDTEEELVSFKNKCYEIMLRYNYLFLFPFGVIPIVDNKYRNTDSSYQSKIHFKIEEMLSDFKLSYIFLERKTMSREERLSEVLYWIKKE